MSKDLEKLKPYPFYEWLATTLVGVIAMGLMLVLPFDMILFVLGIIAMCIAPAVARIKMNDRKELSR